MGEPDRHIKLGAPSFAFFLAKGGKPQSSTIPLSTLQQSWVTHLGAGVPSGSGHGVFVFADRVGNARPVVSCCFLAYTSV
jgi:hypothetical protein